ncbi:MAG: hypothetical protein RIR96_255 [Bacteroidota bacterium]|jgi:hypothetical protein
MKRVVLILSLLLPLLGISQDVDFDKKTNEINIDGKPAFKIDRQGCGFGDIECYYKVLDLNGKFLFRANMREFNSPVEVSQANPKGRVIYLEFVFPETKQKAEIVFPGIKSEKVGKVIVKNGLIKEGALDQKAIDDFVFNAGTPFSERVRF